jgi:hypothetical protein
MKHYLGICLVLVTVAALGLFALHSCTAAVDQTIDQVRNAFSEVLKVQPEVTVNQRVVLTQTAPIAELAVVTKEELITIGLNEHLEVMSMPIPLTEKKMSVEATYRIKAGFDLKKPFSVGIDPVTHALHAALPHAEILSVEQIGDLTYHGEDALLNRITDEERTQILSNLNAAAHDAAEKSNLKMDAEQQVTQRLNELIKHNGETMEIDWKSATPAINQKP